MMIMLLPYSVNHVVYQNSMMRILDGINYA